MSNSFEGRKNHGEKWRIKEERSFNAEELDIVVRAKIVGSRYGLSCRITMMPGGIIYIPMAKDSIVFVGEVIDLSKSKVLTLERPRKQDTYRIYYDHNV